MIPCTIIFLLIISLRNIFLYRKLRGKKALQIAMEFHTYSANTENALGSRELWSNLKFLNDIIIYCSSNHEKQQNKEWY